MSGQVRTRSSHNSVSTVMSGQCKFKSGPVKVRSGHVMSDQERSDQDRSAQV